MYIHTYIYIYHMYNSIYAYIIGITCIYNQLCISWNCPSYPSLQPVGTRLVTRGLNPTSCTLSPRQAEQLAQLQKVVWHSSVGIWFKMITPKVER